MGASVGTGMGLICGVGEEETSRRGGGGLHVLLTAQMIGVERCACDDGDHRAERHQIGIIHQPLPRLMQAGLHGFKHGIPPFGKKDGRREDFIYKNGTSGDVPKKRFSVRLAAVYSFRRSFVAPTFGVFHRLNPPQVATIPNVPLGGRLYLLAVTTYTQMLPLREHKACRPLCGNQAGETPKVCQRS